jgi:hypothetical protein
MTLLAVGGATERMKAELLGVGEHSFDEPRLADAERPNDDQYTAIAGSGPPEHGARRRQLVFTSFDGGMEDPSGANRRAARKLALKRQRLRGRLRANPPELLAKQTELARRPRSIAARCASAHQRPVRLLVRRLLQQHVLPTTLRAHHR